MELAEKNTTNSIKEEKKNEKLQAYVATYNKNNPELWTTIIQNFEIMDNLEELENKDKIKNILDTTQIT